MTKSTRTRKAPTAAEQPVAAPARKKLAAKGAGTAAPRSRRHPLKTGDEDEMPVAVESVPSSLLGEAVPAARQAEPEKSVRDEILEVLASQLRVSVEDGDFTDPNRRTLRLYLGKKCISQTSFDVRSRREYEG